jgi:hypothetical protein
MPNWCENELIIVGPSDKVQKFLEAAGVEGKTPLSFQRLRPVPQEFLQSDGWYRWRVVNWGTKWDVDGEGDVLILDDLYADGIRRVGMSFSTPWGPPDCLFRFVAPQHPDLTFELRYDMSYDDHRGALRLRGDAILEEDPKYPATYASMTDALLAVLEGDDFYNPLEDDEEDDDDD